MTPIKGENIVKESKVPIFHYDSDLFCWILNLPQLRKEYLAILGINPFRYSNIFLLTFKMKLKVRNRQINQGTKTWQYIVIM